MYILFHRLPVLLTALLYLLLSILPASGAQRGLTVNSSEYFPTHNSGQLGAFKALIIGIDTYLDPTIPTLTTAAEDAQVIAGVLEKEYGFKTTLLLNKQATKGNLYKALRKLVADSKDTDSVLIYYAGHGDLDKVYNDGWWIPTDAVAGDPMSYLDNGQVQKAMRSMNARHVLLISDSCYSGTLFGDTRSIPPVINDKYYLGLYSDRSRWGLTSGNREPVSDLGSGKHSIFAGQLIKELKRTDRSFFTIRDIYTRIAPIIANNSEQHPICRPMRGVGDQGGEFVFVRVAGGKAVTNAPLPGTVGVQDAPLPAIKVGMLTVRTQPKQATVYINGVSEGLAPVQIENLDPGTVSLEARKAGYLTQREKARIRANRRTEVLLIMEAEPIPPGRLFIRPSPQNAKIRILNIAPHYNEGIELPPGRYHIEVSHKEFKTGRKWIDLRSGEDLVVEFELNKIFHKLAPPKEIIKEKVVIKKVFVEVPVEVRVEVPVPVPAEKDKPIGPTLGTTWQEPTTGMEFVWIEGGCFTMGSPSSEQGRDSDEQQHEVCVDGFYLGSKEVTQQQWLKVMAKNPSKFKEDNELPVEQVSWKKIQKFLREISNDDYTFQLPTEAEWEYAARAGTDTPFYYGESISSEEVNYDGNHPYGDAPAGDYPRRTTPVGSYPPNAWGLYDMHGNVWEWVRDWYGEDYYASSPRTNPTGAAASWNRVIRGGGWYSYGKGCRSANRDWNGANDHAANLGFRVRLIPAR